MKFLNKFNCWFNICKTLSFSSGAVMPLNQTSHNDSKCDSFTNNDLQNVVPALYLLMFPVALLLNGTATWVSLHLKSTSTFIVYLKNLVAADVIMTLIIPIKAAGVLPGVSNMFFIFSCYISPVFYSTQYTCITLLGVISLDRFFKIMTPQSRLVTQNLTVSIAVSVSIWVVLFGSSALPNIILSNKSVANMKKISSCMNLKGPVGRAFHEG